MTKILSVVGARPNFMKIAPLAGELQDRRVAGALLQHVLVHTGQHYDEAMSESFFKALDIPEPDYHLAVGSGTHAYQIGTTMMAFEEVLRKELPDWVVLVGDVNATCACSIIAKKYETKLAHIEAGLRSGDMSMPEEINRLVCDRLADVLFTTSHLADANLEREAVPSERIVRVGNIMIDTLECQRDQAAALDPQAIIEDALLAGQPTPPLLADGGFGILTLHRPSNVDHPEILTALVDVLLEIAGELPLVFPVHPRTLQQLEASGLDRRMGEAPGMLMVRALTYHELLRCNMGAAVCLTDSGGLQEECCVLGTPCLTLRWNTERPITLLEHGGCNQLVGNDPARIRQGYQAARQRGRQPTRPPLWDGHAAERIADWLLAH